MKIQREYTETFLSTELTSHEATIAMTPEVFDMLIKGIYNDKPLAAVREPIFNAIDSHVEAGRRDVAIDIHVPTALEPWFSVRDYGMGMSHEVITKLYMNVGESTKRKSNELVGAKGIGSKAPFAFTDMFSVISISNGKRTSYSVHLNKGIPNVTPTFSVPTVEGNGVEIKFAVDEGQFQKIRVAIKKCLSFVTSPYNINDPTLMKEMESEKPRAYITHKAPGSGWRLELYPNSTQITKVVMGQQAYECSALKRLGVSCALFVNIGDCDVNPSRESVVEGDEEKFSELAKTFIKEAEIEIKRQMEEKVKDCKSMAEFRVIVKDTPDWFAKRYLFTWFADKFHSVYGLEKLDNLVTYEDYGDPEWRRRGKKEDTLKVTDILYMGWIWADKRVALRRRASMHGDVVGASKVIIFDKDSEAAARLKNDPFFAGGFVLATDIKLPANYSPSGGRLKGHKVGILDREGDTQTSSQYSREDFDQVDYYIMRRGGGSTFGYHTFLGHWDNISNGKALFELLGIDADYIHLISPQQSRWLPATAVEVTREMFFEAIKKKLILNTVFNSGRYTEARRRLKHFGIKVFDFNERRQYHGVDMSYHERQGFNTEPEVMRRMERIIARYEKFAADATHACNESYPLVAEVGYDKYNSPDVVNYRRAMDFYKMKGGK